MHVHELRAENFKRLHAVAITFPDGGGTVEIAGRNGMGKSSCIDALMAALAGKDACPEQPVRNGARSAYSEVSVGEYRVRRDWSPAGTRLTVTAADGHKISSPQALLDGLFNTLAFDPLEFTRQGRKEQAATLRHIAGLDFGKLDAQRAGKYAERTQVNRAIAAQEAVVADMPDVPEAAEVSAEDLGRELQRASRHNGDAQRARLAMAQAQRDAEDAEDHVDRLVQEIAAAVDRMQDARARLATARGRIMEEIDTAPILERITEVDRNNQKARQYRARKEAVEQLAANKEHAARLTDDLDDIDAQRQAMLQDAAFPVAGLSLDGDTVIFNGVPFAQVSTSEQIRVSLGIGAALNPRLRLVVIREGSLLDEGSLRLVAAWAEEHDCQVLVERVADATIGPGVVIEEGRIKEGRGDGESADASTLFV